MILTIEEDEQKLMHEEAQDSSDLKKKEDGMYIFNLTRKVFQ